MKEPNYDGAISKIVGAFKRARSSISSALGRMFNRGSDAKAARDAEKESSASITKLNEESKAWIKDNLTRAVTDGTKGVRSSLKLPIPPSGVQLTKANREMLRAAIASTNADVLAVTQNMDRKTKASIRQALAESLRANLSQNVNNSKSISSDVLSRIRATLGSALDTGIIDAAGRRWKPEVYVDMLVSTKLAEAHRNATINESLERDVLYATISSHGAKDACSRWEGRTVKLVEDAPGDYPYVGDLNTREIFHPRCRHILIPIRNPN